MLKRIKKGLKRLTRKPMSDEKKQEARDRMNKYWADRKKAEKNPVKGWDEKKDIRQNLADYLGIGGKV